MTFRAAERAMGTPLSKLASLAIFALAFAACGSAEPSASPGPAVQWGPIAAFLSPAQMDARNEGVLRITDRCTFLERGGDRAFLAWPAERTRWDPDDASIAFRMRSGVEVTVRDGDEIVLGGGGSSRVEDGKTGGEWAAGLVWVAPPDPVCLIDVRWEISEVEPQ